jgi:excisionase family DNA binding protein
MGQCAMASLSLREAAELAGTSKSTIFRAIKAGKLSAARLEDNGFAIDPAELCRVYPPKNAVAGKQSAQHLTGHGAPVAGMAGNDPELATRVAVMEAELAGLKAMVSELRTSRDQWQTQAERVTLALAGPERPSLWKRLVG